MSRKIPDGKYHCRLTSIWTFRNLNILFICLAVVYGFDGFAQKYSSTDTKAIRSYENALKSFDSRNGDLALQFIDEALKRDPDFIETYLLRFEIFAEKRNLPMAEKALEDAVAINPDFFPNAWFFLGTIEMKQGKYEEAAPHLRKFKTYSGVNPEMTAAATKEILNTEFAVDALTRPVNFDPKNMGEAINSEMPEYYPCISADGATFIFTRLVNDRMAFQGKNEDFYVSSNREGTWFPAVPLRGVNSILNEGAPTLSSDGRTLVFTGCELNGDYGPGRKGYGSCDLFISKNLGGQWLPPQNLGPAINTANWETQPSLSSDGSTLYFIRGKSARTGVQNQDIYYSNRETDGSWAAPQKVSDKINSPEREESVHIHPDGQSLYFSSNGHPGMGGLDLYVSRRDTAGEWQVPVNLGYPINTAADENSILISAQGDLAFYASDRDGGFGNLDLYTFELPKAVRPMPVTFAKGRVSDGDTGEPLGSFISVTDVENRSDKRTFNSDDRSGEFLVALNTGNNYAMTVKSEGYLLHSETFTLSNSTINKGYALDVKLYKVKEGASFVLKNLFFDLDKDILKAQSKPELEELVVFMQANPDIILEVGGHTDNQGKAAYNADLSLRRAEAVKDYLVAEGGLAAERIKTKGYGAVAPIATNDTDAGRAQNRRTEFKIISKG